MNYDFYNTGTGAPTTETTEERMTKNERKRVLGYIRAYAKNPDNPRWSPQMVMKIQQMADTYDIPWSPQKPDPGFFKKGAAAIGGVVDAALLDFIPDKAYTAAGAEGYAEAGKLASLPIQVAAAILSGGTSAAVTGASWAATKKLGAGALARKATGLTLGGGIARAAKPAIAPLAARFGLGQGAIKKSADQIVRQARSQGGQMNLFGAADDVAEQVVKGQTKMGSRFSEYVQEGVKGVARKSKKAAIQELQTLRGGADNARVVELLKTGHFSPREIRGIASSIIGKGGTKAGRKAATDALLEQVLPGGVGGKLTGSVINKLAKAPKKILDDLAKGGGLNTKKKVKAWVDSTLKGTSRLDKDAIIKEIVESEAKTVKDLLKIGARMSGKAKTAASVAPDFAGALPSTLGLGALSTMGMQGQDPDIDPLRPYYSATTGQ